tara:strand:+ start:1620 stop:2177 length:558 start_codon:yes stop_codon:yes gene_type:complete
MLKPISKNFRGLITISGPTKSGKSQLAEFLIKEQDSITYIATSKPRKHDPEWERRIDVHRRRRPSSWKLVEHPLNICKAIHALDNKESILIDSLGGLVEQHLLISDGKWELFQTEFLESLINNNYGIIVVSEEIGWGIVPATPMGHLFRERLSNLFLLLNRHSIGKWLAVNGTAINLYTLGDQIP